MSFFYRSHTGKIFGRKVGSKIYDAVIYAIPTLLKSIITRTCRKNIFYKNDDAITAYSKDELTSYNNYAQYDGKVICTTLAETNKQDNTVRNIWAKGTVFYNLGIDGYYPEL